MYFFLQVLAYFLSHTMDLCNGYTEIEEKKKNLWILHEEIFLNIVRCIPLTMSLKTFCMWLKLCTSCLLLHTKSLSQSIYMGYICEFWQEKQQQFKLSKTYIRSSTYKIWYSSSIQSIVGVIGNTYQSCDISIQVSANTKFTGCPRKTQQNFFSTLYPFFGRFWPPDDPNTLQTPN